ncbi:MAG: DUF4129 domain-containing protein [Deltaproteobacteria bacterium]|nr:DUF4129 domain-containing protein [Deltaproteobacteria bacterium]MCB9786517.1 DUF4129 domain-containing protein [Deltaproteobacteria bacterium]
MTTGLHASRWLVGALACLALADADAAPLRVRGHSALELRVERAPQGLYLRARLTGDEGAPLADQAVQVSVEGLAGRTFLTDAEGRFELLIAATDARNLAETLGERLAVELSYEGDATWGPAQQTEALELRREPTWVELELDPPRAGLQDAQVAVRAAIQSADGPVGEAPIRLQVGDGPELTGDSDASGQVTFLVRPASLDRAGAFTVRAAYGGDHRYAPSEAASVLRVMRPTRLTLRVGREGDERSGRYRFSGRLSDDRGGVPDATVAIVAGVAGQQAASETVAVTDADGVYLAAVDVRELASRVQGVVEVRARYLPTDGLRSPAESPAARIPVPPPPGVPLGWYALALTLAAANLLLVGAVRQRLLAWLSGLRERWRAAPESGPVLGAEPALVVAPARGADLRKDWLAGSVVDAHHGRTLVRAAILLRREDDGSELRAAPQHGRFAMGPLPPGAWRLMLSAPGYLERETPLQIPHDGSFDGATLALVSVRGRVRDLFVAGMARLGHRVRWGIETPAEAARRVSADPAAAALREAVEQAWFGADAPDADAARRAEVAVESIGSPR